MRTVLRMPSLPRAMLALRSLGAAGALANVAEDTAAREAQARAVDALVRRIERRPEPLSRPAA